MKETLIVLLVFYSMYVGYFIKVNETTFKRANPIDKILMVSFGFCGLWINLLLDIIIFLKSKLK